MHISGKNIKNYEDGFILPLLLILYEVDRAISKNIHIYLTPQREISRDWIQKRKKILKKRNTKHIGMKI